MAATWSASLFCCSPSYGYENFGAHHRTTHLFKRSIGDFQFTPISSRRYVHLGRRRDHITSSRSPAGILRAVLSNGLRVEPAAVWCMGPISARGRPQADVRHSIRSTRRHCGFRGPRHRLGEIILLSGAAAAASGSTRSRLPRGIRWHPRVRAPLSRVTQLTAYFAA